MHIHHELTSFIKTKPRTQEIWENSVVLTVNGKTYKGVISSFNIETPIGEMHELGGKIFKYQNGPMVMKAEVVCYI